MAVERDCCLYVLIEMQIIYKNWYKPAYLVSLDLTSTFFLYTQKEIRSSLVLSMLQQMLMEDKADLVREAVIKSLGIIMGYIDDPDKYQQVQFELDSVCMECVLYLLCE